MKKVKGMRPLTPSKGKIESALSKTFCATLPSEKEVTKMTKAFCATLPSEKQDPVKLAKAFCATLPSESEIGRKIRKEVLKTTKK